MTNIKQADYVATLTEELQSIVKGELATVFTQEGLQGDEHTEAVDTAMDGRLSDLDGIMNVVALVDTLNKVINDRDKDLEEYIDGYALLDK